MAAPYIIYILHELVVRARQLASVAQLGRALHRNHRAAIGCRYDSFQRPIYRLHFLQLFLVRSNKHCGLTVQNKRLLAVAVLAY
jgi:hypothetical protein